MAFEVKAVDGTLVTLGVTSYEMGLDGTVMSIRLRVIDMAKGTTAAEPLTIGNVQFAAFDIASASVTVGDKFLLNITPQTAVPDDLVTITQTTDENGASVSRSFTYYKQQADNWDNKTTTVDYLTLDDQTGDIKHSEISLTFSTLGTTLMMVGPL